MRYNIKMTRHYFGPEADKTELLCDWPDLPESFGSFEAAERRIEELDAEVYVTSSAESARPAYEIVEAA